MRMPELKSNYSRIRNTELVAFLTIWVRIILRCEIQRACGSCSCTRFQRFIKPFDLQPLAQHLYIWGQYINQGKIKLQSIQVSKLVIPAIIYFL